MACQSGRGEQVGHTEEEETPSGTGCLFCKQNQKTMAFMDPGGAAVAHCCLLLAEPGMEPRNMVCRFLLQHHSGAHKGKFEVDSVT